MKVLGLTAILAGCNFQSTRAPGAEVDASTSAPPPDAAAVDAAQPDAMTPIDAQSCFGVGIVKVCLATLPPGPITLPGRVNTIDTGQSTNCDQIVAQQAGPPLCVIVGTTVTVNGAFFAVGTRPLVVIGTDSITINGNAKIDVSSVTGSQHGAGGNAGECSRSDKGHDDSGGAGGGGGGSFGTVGGKGGTGDLDDSASPNGAATGGNPGAADPTPIVLHGGCIGGAGGEGQNKNGGAGGDGGGAVYLIAGKTIAVMGDIFASGAGGRANLGSGGRMEGAGGGGSGGMIVLDAPMNITVQGRVVANGGGGGGGGGNVGGTRGGDGTTLLWNQRATAGIGDPAPLPGPAGDGAPGTATGALTSLDGENSNLGGGGGGGGIGLIWTYGTLNGGAMMSPAPNQH